ncbi:MAG: hypothetical protein ACR2HY_01920 [Acidimicrobiales bacterium]
MDGHRLHLGPAGVLVALSLSVHSPRSRPLAAPDLPAEVARDSVEHTWASFSQAFDSLVGNADVVAWAGTASARLVVVQGDDDPIAPPALVTRVLGHTQVEIRTLPGDHHLPLRRPASCLKIVREVIGAE